jgi:hypothetical protein
MVLLDLTTTVEKPSARDRKKYKQTVFSTLLRGRKVHAEQHKIRLEQTKSQSGIPECEAYPLSVNMGTRDPVISFGSDSVLFFEPDGRQSDCNISNTDLQSTIDVDFIRPHHSRAVSACFTRKERKMPELRPVTGQKVRALASLSLPHPAPMEKFSRARTFSLPDYRNVAKSNCIPSRFVKPKRETLQQQRVKIYENTYYNLPLCFDELVKAKNEISNIATIIDGLDDSHSRSTSAQSPGVIDENNTFAQSPMSPEKPVSEPLFAKILAPVFHVSVKKRRSPTSPNKLVNTSPTTWDNNMRIRKDRVTDSLTESEYLVKKLNKKSKEMLETHEIFEYVKLPEVVVPEPKNYQLYRNKRVL